MKNIGVVKEFDKLGRIVIPKDFRDRFNLNKEVEITMVEDGILLRNNKYKLIPSEEKEETCK